MEEKYIPTLTLSSNLSAEEVKNNKGIKLLMKVKNAQTIYDNYTGTSIDEYYKMMRDNDIMINQMKEELDKEELEMIKESHKTDSIKEKSENMLSDVDAMIKEIKEMRQKIHDIKLNDKIKSKEDFLKYMNIIIPNNNNNNDSISDSTTINTDNKDFKKRNNILLENDFKIDENKINEYKKYIIPNDDERNNDYNSIIEKLKNQENEINEVKNKQIKRKKNPKKKLRKKPKFETGDSNIDKLFAEINMVNSRMDNYLKDIDECLEMNEKINKKLDSHSNNSNSLSNEEEKNSN
jgi:hypothetical protein